MNYNPETGEIIEESMQEIELVAFKAEITPVEIKTNFEEVEKILTEGLKDYEVEVTDENIKEAKKKATALNKLRGTVDRIRIDKAREAKFPITEWEKKVKSIIEKIDDGRQMILDQTEKFESKIKARCKELMEEIRDEMYESLQIREEFRTIECDDLAILSNMANKKLSKRGEEAIRSRLTFAKMKQDKIDFRMMRLSQDSSDLAAQLERVDIEHIIEMEDVEYEAALANIISSRKEQEEKIKKSIEDKKNKEEEQRQKDEERAKQIVEQKQKELDEIKQEAEQKVNQSKKVANLTKRVKVTAVFELDIKKEISTKAMVELFSNKLADFKSLCKVEAEEI